jgi:hypothetical protein
MRMTTSTRRKSSPAELLHQREEESLLFKEAAARMLKELEKYCPSVRYSVHGTYLFKEAHGASQSSQTTEAPVA